MVARLFRLRVALLGSVFRGGFRPVSRRLLVGLVSVIAAAALAWLPGLLDRGDEDVVSTDVFLASVVLIVALAVPLFGRPGNLSPRQFAMYPVSAASLAASLFVTTLCTLPVCWLLVWMGALVVRNPEWVEAPWAVATWVVLTLLIAIALVRLASGFVQLVVPRRGISVLRWTGLLLSLAALPVVVFMLADALGAPRGSTISDAAAVFAWTPFGAPLAGLEFAVAGDLPAAFGRFAVAAGSLAVLIALWHLVVARSVTSVERPAPAGLASDGLELFERFPARPREVIAARSLTYWRRDPRYRVALFAIPLAPVTMVAALWIAGAPLQTLALLPLPVILLLLGWSVHNDVAFDSTAVWMHVASGTRGRHDRAGRLAPVMLIGLPLAIVGSSITVTVSGDWRILPAVVGMNVSVLLVSSGASSVFSALMPYPATRPGDSPFAQPAVQGSGAGLAQTFSMLAALLLSLPPVIFAVPAFLDPTFGLNVCALLAGLGWGALILWAGVVGGGMIFDRRAPRLLGLTQTFD